MFRNKSFCPILYYIKCSLKQLISFLHICYEGHTRWTKPALIWLSINMPPLSLNHESSL